jgi:molecular chaperone HscB
LAVDFFALLGLPRKLRIDMNDFEQRYRARSRQVHPDYFLHASAAERRASLEQASRLNDAYRALRHPVSRVEHLLALEGLSSPPRVPPARLEELFALNEELDEIRALRASGAAPGAWQPRLERVRRPIDAWRDEHEAALQELSQRWDAAVDRGAAEDERREVLEALAARLSERQYISNLIASIDREWDEEKR